MPYVLGFLNPMFIASIFIIFLYLRSIAYLITFLPLVLLVGIHEQQEVEHKLHFYIVAPNTFRWAANWKVIPLHHTDSVMVAKYFSVRRLLLGGVFTRYTPSIFYVSQHIHWIIIYYYWLATTSSTSSSSSSTNTQGWLMLWFLLYKVMDDVPLCATYY